MDFTPRGSAQGEAPRAKAKVAHMPAPKAVQAPGFTTHVVAPTTLMAAQEIQETQAKCRDDPIIDVRGDAYARYKAPQQDVIDVESDTVTAGAPDDASAANVVYLSPLNGGNTVRSDRPFVAPAPTIDNSDTDGRAVPSVHAGRANHAYMAAAAAGGPQSVSGDGTQHAHAGAARPVNLVI